MCISYIIALDDKVVPEKLPGGAYLVTNQSTEGMSEKEKEAFGFSSPEVSDDLPSAPSKVRSHSFRLIFIGY